MNMRIQKWGNSRALRISKPFAKEARIDQKATVTISVKDGKLIIAPQPAASIPLIHYYPALPKKHPPGMGNGQVVEKVDAVE